MLAASVLTLVGARGSAAVVVALRRLQRSPARDARYAFRCEKACDSLPAAFWKSRANQAGQMAKPAAPATTFCPSFRLSSVARADIRSLLRRVSVWIASQVRFWSEARTRGGRCGARPAQAPSMKMRPTPPTNLSITRPSTGYTPMLAGNWGVRMRSIRVSTQFSALAGESVWVDVGCRACSQRARALTPGKASCISRRRIEQRARASGG